MQWQAIANVTSELNDQAKGYLINKLTQDASVEAPNLWSDFLSTTTKHLRDSQSYLEVTTDEKTGSLTCLTNFDPMHEDFLEHGKPFTQYALGKYDSRTSSTLSQTKNPFTRKFLEQRIGNYRMGLAENLASTEVKLIDGKRHSMAIDAVEKLKNSVYDNPNLYQDHLTDGITAINSLALLPQEKDKLLHHSKDEIAYAAALGTLKYSPHSILDKNNNVPWKADLSFEQRIRIESQAKHLIEHRQKMVEHQLNSLLKPHFDSIIKTGKGIAGFDNLVAASFGASDPRKIELEQQVELYKQAFVVSEQIKHLPFSEGNKLIMQLQPEGNSNANDLNYEQSTNLYNILIKEQQKQIKAAKDDPARFVEELFKDSIPNSIPFEQRLLYRKNLQSQKAIASYNQKYLMNKEKEDFLERIVDIAKSGDVRAIRNEIDSIISIGKGNYQIGLDILGEILETQDKLAPATHFYAENHLFKETSKERADLASTFACMIPITEDLAKAKKDNQNKPFKDQLKTKIASHKILNTFLSDYTAHQPHNIKDARLISKGITDLAWFYHIDRELDASDALDKAINVMINNIYFSPLEGTWIPRQIIDDSKIQNLNEDYIKASLQSMRHLMLSGKVKFNYDATFGIDPTNTANSNTASTTKTPIIKHERGKLANGKWMLSPDKKSVYYTYLLDSGEYRPVMQDEDNILTFSLTDLNSTEPRELYVQRSNYELMEFLHKLPKYGHRY